MKRILAGAAVPLVLIALTGPAEAQGAAKHQGFWIGFGLGGGWNLSSTVNNETKPGAAAYLRMGGTPSERFLIGGEILGWGTDVNNITFGRGNATVTVLYYLDSRQTVYLKGGVGGSSFTRSMSIGNTTTTTTDNGFGTTAGVGWDVRLGRNFYLTPGLDFLYQRVSVNSVTLNNTIVLLTVGATWH